MRFPYSFIYFLYFESCLKVPKLRLKTQSKKTEREKAENQYFPYNTLIRRAIVEAYCPTLVELVCTEGDVPTLFYTCPDSIPRVPKLYMTSEELGEMVEGAFADICTICFSHVDRGTHSSLVGWEASTPSEKLCNISLRSK
jgi:hypothetical protein